MDTRQVIARFQAEQQALAMMDHPNIARVLDAGTTEEVRTQRSEVRREEPEGRVLTSDLCPLTSGLGRPYFVMELVKGIPITQYCDEHHLTPRQRLELFVPVCHAVQHAHQKGIIHRDIKPTNVLVAEYDDRPVPKIIDFGVAKAIQQRLTERTVFTQLGQVVGTIDYMSPEQAKLNQLDVDTRSDIYSLGVLLYELLTGETPFDRQRLHAAAFDELLRIIREEDPPKPSVRLSSSQSLPSIAANRQIEPKKLSTLVRGELDWIVMKALEKDRSRRYDTANAFAADVEHYLTDEPVVACPPSAAYRFRKFASRNRAVLTMLASVGAILLLAALVSTWQAVRATRAFRSEMAARHEAEHAHREADDARKQAEKDRDRAVEAERAAQEQRDRAQSAEKRAEANFLKARAAVDEYFTHVSDSELSSVPGLQPLRRDLIKAALKYYEGFAGEQAEQGDVQISLAGAHARLGLIRHDLGDLEAAGRSFTRAIKLLEAMRQRGQDAPAVRALLAHVCLRFHRYDETVRLCRELLASDPEHVEINRVEVSRLLGWAYHHLGNGERDAGRLDAALKWHKQAYTMWEELLHRFPDSPADLNGLGETLLAGGLLLEKQGRHRDALDIYLQSVACNRRAYEFIPSSFPLGRTLTFGLMKVADAQMGLRLDQEALATLEQLVALRRKLVFDHPAASALRGDLYQAWQALGKQQQKLGRTDAAQASFRAALEILENMPHETPVQMFELATVYSRLAQPPAKQAEMPSDQDPAESERNADLALQMLAKAVDAGYRDIQTLRSWPGLAPLRERDDFRQLLAGLEKTIQAEQSAARNSGPEADKPAGQQSAAAPLKEQVSEQPENVEYRQILSASRHAIGVMETELKQYDEAEQSLERALALRETLRKEQPEDAQTALKLAETRFALGQVYWDEARRPEAHRLWQAALLDLHWVAMQNPEDHELQQRVASFEREICQQYGAMGLWDLAATAARHNAALKRITDYGHDVARAALLAVSGERESWAAYCRQAETELPAKAPRSGLSWDLIRLVRTGCLLEPAAIHVEAWLGPVENQPKGDCFRELSLGLLLCRSGRHEEALKAIESNPASQCPNLDQQTVRQPWSAFLVAIAAHGSLQHESAWTSPDSHRAN